MFADVEFRKSTSDLSKFETTNNRELLDDCHLILHEGGGFAELAPGDQELDLFVV